MTSFGVKWPREGWYAVKKNNQPTNQSSTPAESLIHCNEQEAEGKRSYGSKWQSVFAFLSLSLTAHRSFDFKKNKDNNVFITKYDGLSSSMYINSFLCRNIIKYQIILCCLRDLSSKFYGVSVFFW